jgi:hypothetical protein
MFLSRVARSNARLMQHHQIKFYTILYSYPSIRIPYALIANLVSRARTIFPIITRDTFSPTLVFNGSPSVIDEGGF